MLATKPKSRKALERAVAKYEVKLAKALNPTQRQYAARMLAMARSALANSEADTPIIEDKDGVVTLGKDEYDVL